MDKSGELKVGVYVDASNIALNGGYGMHYDVLREFACRNNGVAVRLNAYVAYDEEMAKKNVGYRRKSEEFHSVLRDFGYKVIVKIVKWFEDEHGNRFGKSNADLDMAVDALLQSQRLDYVLMVTGDGDFVQVVRALQNKGCRVEALAFKNVSRELIRETDVFTSGYLVPGLVGNDVYSKDVAEFESEVRHARGVCYAYYPEKGYGFMRFLKKLGSGLWITDSRRSESPYATAFVHSSHFPENFDARTLPNREQIFEFDVRKVPEKGYQAENVKIIYNY